MTYKFLRDYTQKIIDSVPVFFGVPNTTTKRIAQEIKQIGLSVLYDMNTAALRAKIVRDLTPQIQSVFDMRAGYLCGVFCDALNNTVDIIDQHKLVIDVVFRDGTDYRPITIRAVIAPDPFVTITIV